MLFPVKLWRTWLNTEIKGLSMDVMMSIFFLDCFTIKLWASFAFRPFQVWICTVTSINTITIKQEKVINFSSDWSHTGTGSSEGSEINQPDRKHADNAISEKKSFYTHSKWVKDTPTHQQVMTFGSVFTKCITFNETRFFPNRLHRFDSIFISLWRRKVMIFSVFF